ncbi:MAG TPA: hypothetical protein VMF65_21070 [Acidimicrobiales bacterium]|nr:hypothetical protein [Acidimicrobiales bacterium]
MTYRYASTADIVMAVVGSTATSSWAVRAPTELQLLASTESHVLTLLHSYKSTAP